MLNARPFSLRRGELALEGFVQPAAVQRACEMVLPRRRARLRELGLEVRDPAFGGVHGAPGGEHFLAARSVLA
jgi:hypothetical protein